MHILVINGPNMNLLGTREPEIYGYDSLEDIREWLENQAPASNHTLRWFQSNHEGDIIDLIHQQRDWADGILINPAAYTHYSYAIRDAVSAVDVPTVEVHYSNLEQREEFRKISVIAPVCVGRVQGLGKRSYLRALELLLEHLTDSSYTVDGDST